MCRANGDGGTGRDAYGGVLAPGTTASNDGQFFSTTRQGEANNLVNAKKDIADVGAGVKDFFIAFKYARSYS